MIFWHLEDHRPPSEGGDPPAGLLSDAEREVFGALRLPKRRADWLLGRQAVKQLCCHYLARRGQPTLPAELAVVNAQDGAPEVVGEGGHGLPFTVSLSHRAGMAVAALCPAAKAPLGIDLELCEPRGAGFAADFFTTEELDLVEQAPPTQRVRLETEVWSLKEAALKALRVGLRADTRSIRVEPRRAATNGWGPLWSR
jgi:4'-phosphopantetheinyl transferase